MFRPGGGEKTLALSKIVAARYLNLINQTLRAKFGISFVEVSGHNRHTHHPEIRMAESER